MTTAKVPSELLSRVTSARSVAVITGAGMSAESGVPTFRDASTGLWAQFDAYELASPEGWKANKARVWAWYEWRRGLVSKAMPNAGHHAIAKLAELYCQTPVREGAFTLITQNVDDLHERSGSDAGIHVHGSLFSPRCSACSRPAIFPSEPPEDPIESIAPPICEHCGGYVRPGVVWFGENLDAQLLGRATRAIKVCDVLLIVGTSGVVRPISDLPRIAREGGAWVCEINPVETEVSHVANCCWRSTAAQALPAVLASIQNEAPSDGR